MFNEARTPEVPSSGTPEAQEKSRLQLLKDAEDLLGGSDETSRLGGLHIRQQPIWFDSIVILIGQCDRAGVLNEAQAQALSAKVSVEKGSSEADAALKDLILLIKEPQ